MSDQLLYVGMDPGITGACASLWPDGSIESILHMPSFKLGKMARVNAAAVSAWLAGRPAPIVLAVVEEVNAMPSGGQSMGTSSAFNFGHSAGVLDGVIAANGIATRGVPAGVWKRRHGLIGKDKDAARALCIKTYPQSREFDTKVRGQAAADAVLIARFGILFSRTDTGEK